MRKRGKKERKNRGREEERKGKNENKKEREEKKGEMEKRERGREEEGKVEGGEEFVCFVSFTLLLYCLVVSLFPLFPFMKFHCDIIEQKELEG